MSTKQSYRMAIVASHPIQYHAHWFRSLAAHAALDVTVFFGHAATASDQGRAGFTTNFEWDVPLLQGYPYQFLKNTSRSPGLDRFWGISTPEIARVIRREHFDAVLVLGWQHASDWQAIRSCWASGTSLLVRGDSNLLSPRSIPKRALKRMLHGKFIPRFDACLAVGTWSEAYYRHYGARRVFRVPHSIDHSQYRPAKCVAARTNARVILGLPPDTTVFLFAGKLIDQKRPLDFVDAVAATASRGESVYGLMVGDGPLMARVDQRVHENQAPVRLAGFMNQSQMLSAYHASDVLILPSDSRETWGLVVNEAMASGLPCLVSDQVGCGPDLVLSGRTGDVFPFSSVEQLAGLMTYYASHRSVVQEMGERAVIHEADYSVRASVEGVVAALKAVVDG